ncbi:hypothetical protein GHT06_014558 [Daphnia sinensis]|uniref:Metalloendopeptidase n=1 Tax=Daphnia sinensis TaxID=1820382 RepID=A0AAD5KQ35_9CRUS|nr:hypothetical protein GHT06_014558 [Daphnia sinensis]
MISLRASWMTILAVSFVCLWLESKVSASPVLLPANKEDDHSVVPVDAVNQNVTIEDFELGEPLNDEELSGNMSSKVPSGSLSGKWSNRIRDELLKKLAGGDIMTLDDNKNAVIDRNSLWPGAQVPYVISASYTPEQRRVLGYAISEFHSKTCIRFVPRTTQANYIYIRRDLNVGCWSYVGMNGNGPQDVSLPDYCVSYNYPGSVMHELMHAIGFQHEHQRPDQQYYITINYPNIRPDNRQFFNPMKSTEVNTLGLPYDIKSVMHYPSSFMANNPSIPTMMARNGELNLGNLKGFTQLDIQKINKLYSCYSG